MISSHPQRGGQELSHFRLHVSDLRLSGYGGRLFEGRADDGPRLDVRGGFAEGGPGMGRGREESGRGGKQRVRLAVGQRGRGEGGREGQTLALHFVLLSTIVFFLTYTFCKLENSRLNRS